MSATEVKSLLIKKFDAKAIDAALKHFDAVSGKFIQEDWDGVALKAGKFVEAVTKALMVHCGKAIPNSRSFKAGLELQQLQHADKIPYSETVRIVIPKACLFVYEIVNNRGGRHDASDVDANPMDAAVIVPIVSWIIAEMVRFCSTDGSTETATNLIEELTNKIYPFFEEIDGRTYVNIAGLKAPDLALLLSYESYPERIGRQELTKAIMRHGVKESAARMAISRLKNVFDDDDGELKLRAVGRQKAEALLKQRAK